MIYFGLMLMTVIMLNVSPYTFLIYFTPISDVHFAVHCLIWSADTAIIKNAYSPVE